MGVPWLVQANPEIDWSDRIVTIQQKGSFVQLPTVQSQAGVPRIDEVNLCSAKPMARWFRRRKVDRAFVGLIRAVPDESNKSGEDQPSKTGVERTFHQDMPENIKAVLSEFSDIFPDDLPPGRPPVRLGHEFRIDLEDDALGASFPAFDRWATCP